MKWPEIKNSLLFCQRDSAQFQKTDSIFCADKENLAQFDEIAPRAS